MKGNPRVPSHARPPKSMGFVEDQFLHAMIGRRTEQSHGRGDPANPAALVRLLTKAPLDFARDGRDAARSPGGDARSPQEARAAAPGGNRTLFAPLQADTDDGCRAGP